MMMLPSDFSSILQISDSDMVSENPSVRKSGTRCNRSTPGVTGRSMLISSTAPLPVGFLTEHRGIRAPGSISDTRNAAPERLSYGMKMRRARVYILILALTLLPQLIAASDLVRWRAEEGQLALGLSVPGL